ncbi:TerC family protein [Camelliibacillus cellulosilyticus]|uniref:TerC family protein n=1 Tax=Camelliibacillus cellulosilyticus TaxID=2174486 RepID=A0ABV9GP16_9BACL
MAMLSLDFITSLLLIIGIDLILAGDNAIVIGLAARNLPKKEQKKAIVWGTVGAVGIRALATLGVVWLLKLPGLHLIGGLLLMWMAYQLLVEKNQHEDVKAGNSLWGAVRTIIIADALMGLDNVLAIAGAADNQYLLVVLGLVISVPIVMWGSTLFIRLIDRYPWVIYIGSAILAFTAAKMAVTEGFIAAVIDKPYLKWPIILVVIAAVLWFGARKNRKDKNMSKKERLEDVGG